MIPGFTGIAGIAFAVVMVVSIRTTDIQRRADFATFGALIAPAIALNALGDLADEWLTVLIWSASSFLSIKAALRHRRAAAEVTRPQHEQVP